MSSIETNRESLMSAIRAVAPIVKRRNKIPVLGSVLIDAQHVTATNLDIQVRAALGVAGRGGKPLCVDFGQLRRLVPFIGADDPITISADGELAFNGAKYGMVRYPAERRNSVDRHGGRQFPSGAFCGRRHLHCHPHAGKDMTMTHQNDNRRALRIAFSQSGPAAQDERPEVCMPCAIAAVAFTIAVVFYMAWVLAVAREMLS